jgi:TPP-dependent pyruvate/acetoin dehydrogenase alpha subunit
MLACENEKKLVTEFSAKILNEMMMKMWLIRLVEEEIVERYHPKLGEQQMRCPVHLSIGQEACAVGICSFLEPQDKIFSTHRCHAHYLAKGGNLSKMVHEIYGKKNGCIQGRGGSMHLMDPDVGMVMSVPIVSSGIPLAVGHALAFKIDKSKQISVSFFGDASMEEGVFHESLNFASLNSLPILFVCENNYYSVYTPLRDRQPSRCLSKLGEAHGIETLTVDGNNLFAVAKVARECINSMKQKSKPILLILDTYRYREHCGVSFDAHLGYRTQDEVEQWQAKDPINLAEKTLIQNHLLDLDDIQKSKNDLKIEIRKVFDLAEQADLPSPLNVNTFVYREF